MFSIVARSESVGSVRDVASRGDAKGREQKDEGKQDVRVMFDDSKGA